MPRFQPVHAATTTLVQDGTYLDALGLKIGEAVSKALFLPNNSGLGVGSGGDTLNGKRALPAGRGRALAEMIAGYVCPFPIECAHVHGS